MQKAYYDVAIIGAGPAGLFAAREIAMKSGLSVVVIEKGKDIEKRRCPLQQVMKCLKCKPCNILSGVGGAGGLSDGKLNLSPDIGGNLKEFTDDADRLIEEIDDVFLKHGASRKLYGSDLEEIERIAARNGIKFIPVKQRHIGSDKLPRVISSFKKELEKMGVEFLVEHEVIEIKPRDKFEIIMDKGSVKASTVLAAVGRSGAEWLAEQAKKLGIKTRYASIDIGVRVEFPAVVMEEITSRVWDPKFHIYTQTYDDFVRTFCTCPYGFVVMEDYGEYISVNGHSTGRKSDNTNFALLVRVDLTEPIENTTAYGMAIAKTATILGGKMPIIQRLGDLRAGRRSTWERIEKSYVEPTFKNATPGDVSMALPHRIVTDIIEGLEKLAKVIPGIAENSTLIYAPEIKFYSMRFLVNKKMETNLPGFFVAGDGAGLSRGIVASAATGILAARGIMEKFSS